MTVVQLSKRILEVECGLSEPDERLPTQKFNLAKVRGPVWRGFILDLASGQTHIRLDLVKEFVQDFDARLVELVEQLLATFLSS